MLASLAMGCGNSERSAEGGPAVGDGNVEKGSGDEISPQLEMDTSERAFEVDTISSPPDESDGKIDAGSSDNP